MGIPFYFRDLVRKHPDVVLDRPPPRHDSNGSSNNLGHVRVRLHFDANSVIHQSSQQVMAGLQEPVALEELEARIHAQIIANIESIVALVRPTGTVFVAVDGLCPMAKLHQQRKRRYVSSWRAQQLGIDTSLWDSNCITPGTAFMERLDARLAAYAAERGYMFSGSNEPGEGEHKIFEYIRDHDHNHNPSQDIVGGIHTDTKHDKSTVSYTDIIYGLDADLIMLSLISPNCKNIWLLRERPHFFGGNGGNSKTAGGQPQQNKHTKQNQNSNHANIKDDEIQGQSRSNVKIKDEVQSKDEYLYLAIGELEVSVRKEHGVCAADYVTLCILMGNDFLPSLSYLKICDDGIVRLMKAYCSLQHDGVSGSPALCDPATASLNFQVLHQLLTLLAKDEDVRLAQACEAYYSRTCDARRFNGNPQDRRAWELDNYPILHKFPRVISPGTAGWRPAYYRFLFPARTEMDRDPNHVCQAYLQGLQWVVRYYFDYSNAGRSWCYQFLYAPTLLDLHNHLSASLLSPAPALINGISVHTVPASTEASTATTPYDLLVANPELQLLCVLPPQSAKRLLRSEAARRLVEDVSQGCVHMFPRGFQLTTFLKHYLWECSPVLPEVDVLLLQRRLQPSLKVDDMVP